jgi:hypothetical protein
LNFRQISGLMSGFLPGWVRLFARQKLPGFC